MTSPFTNQVLWCYLSTSIFVGLSQQSVEPFCPLYSSSIVPPAHRPNTALIVGISIIGVGVFLSFALLLLYMLYRRQVRQASPEGNMKITPFTELPPQSSPHPNPGSHNRTPRRVRATQEKDRRPREWHVTGQTPLPATVSATSERMGFLPEPGLLGSRTHSISQPSQVLPHSQLPDVNNLIKLIAVRIDKLRQARAGTLIRRHHQCIRHPDQKSSRSLPMHRGPVCNTLKVNGG